MSESRVDGTSRTSAATIDYRHNRFELARTMKDGTRIALSSKEESVEVLLDGDVRPDVEFGVAAAPWPA